MRRFSIYWGGRQANPDLDDARNKQVVTVGPFQDYSEMVDWTILFTGVVIEVGNSIAIEDVSFSGDFDSTFTPEQVWEGVKEVRKKS